MTNTGFRHKEYGSHKNRLRVSYKTLWEVFPDWADFALFFLELCMYNRPRKIVDKKYQNFIYTAFKH